MEAVFAIYIQLDVDKEIKVWTTVFFLSTTKSVVLKCYIIIMEIIMEQFSLEMERNLFESSGLSHIHRKYERLNCVSCTHVKEQLKRL